MFLRTPPTQQCPLPPTWQLSNGIIQSWLWNPSLCYWPNRKWYLFREMLARGRSPGNKWLDWGLGGTVLHVKCIIIGPEAFLDMESRWKCFRTYRHSWTHPPILPNVVQLRPLFQRWGSWVPETYICSSSCSWKVACVTQVPWLIAQGSWHYTG